MIFRITAARSGCFGGTEDLSLRYKGIEKFNYDKEADTIEIKSLQELIELSDNF